MKKILFSLILIGFTYATIELFAYFAYRIKFGAYNVHELQLSKQQAIEAKDQGAVFVPASVKTRGVVRRPILHPYLGFSLDAKIRKNNCAEDTPECLTRIKMYTDRPFPKRSPDTVIVAMLGGSFADGTARGGSKDFVQRTMVNVPAFAGKEIIFYNLASGAYKQPQQLMKLAYYLSLGAEFDVVINLDGFNEMAATYYGWRDAGLHPAFPKSWNHRVSSSVTKEYLLAHGDKFQLQESRAGLAGLTSGFPMRWSPLSNILWRILDAGYQRRISEADTRIDALGSPGKENRDFAYEALGPDHNLQNVDELASYAADLWLNSSLAMRGLAEGNGARYYHFLQPNQYIAGAKLLNDAERRVAIVEHGGYGNVYRQTFPELQKRTATLRNQGVHFHDLTYMFKDTPDTLYIDNCCHMNGKGYDLVVKEIVRLIKEDFYDPQPAD